MIFIEIINVRKKRDTTPRFFVAYVINLIDALMLLAKLRKN